MYSIKKLLKHLFYTLIIILLSLSFSFSQDSSQSTSNNISEDSLQSVNNYIYINTEDDEEGAKQIADFLKSHGYNVTSLEKRKIKFKKKDDDYKINTYIVLTGDLDRMIFYDFLIIKDKYKGSSKLYELVRKLNEELNIGTFYIDEDGDIVYRTQLTFNNYFYIDELDGFVDWFKLTILSFIIKYPELYEMVD